MSSSLGMRLQGDAAAALETAAAAQQSEAKLEQKMKSEAKRNSQVGHWIRVLLPTAAQRLLSGRSEGQLWLALHRAALPACTF